MGISNINLFKRFLIFSSLIFLECKNKINSNMFTPYKSMLQYKKKLVQNNEYKSYQSIQNKVKKEIAYKFKKIKSKELKKVIEDIQNINFPEEINEIIINYLYNDSIHINDYTAYCRYQNFHNKATIAHMKYNKNFKNEDNDLASIFCCCNIHSDYENYIENSSICNLICGLYYHCSCFCLQFFISCICCSCCDESTNGRWTCCKKRYIKFNNLY